MDAGTLHGDAVIIDATCPLDRFIDDLAYKADLVGIDHVGLGIDYYEGQHPVEPDDVAMARYEQCIAWGSWRWEGYPPPPYHFYGPAKWGRTDVVAWWDGR